MKKQQLRLLEILKSDSELKQEIEELKFGCVIQYLTHDLWENWEPEWNTYLKYDIVKNKEVTINDYGIDDLRQTTWFKKIWQANYQHLLRYLGRYVNEDDWWFQLNHLWELYCQDYDDRNLAFEIQFDLTKDLLENSEKTIEKLCDYLETLI